MRYLPFGLCVMLAVSSCYTGNKADEENKTDEENKADEEYKTNERLPQLRAEWESEYEAWKALGIQDYQFTKQRDWEISSAEDEERWGKSGSRVTVINGTWYKSIDRRTGVSITTSDLDEYTWGDGTIDDAFEGIAKSFDWDENKSIIHNKGHISTSFCIEYDHEYHFPALIFVGYNYNVPVGGNASETVIKDFTIIDE